MAASEIETPAASDYELTQKAAEGDMKAFEQLYQRHNRRVYSLCLRMTQNVTEAEDLAQEVMLTVYRKAGQVRDHRLFRAWLFKVARHAACRYYAQRSREVPTVDLDDMTHSLAAPPQNPSGPTSEFNDWMKFLDPREQETMTLRFVEQWEYHEIAAAKAIPIGTVQWRVFNSKKKLAPHLSPRQEALPTAA